MATTSYPSDWLRGALEVCVLRVIADGPTYGYAIAERLADAGLGTVKGGTLYPLLNRLENSGLVDIEWRAGDGGPGRKYYHLTPDGIAAQQTAASLWREFADITTTFLTEARA